jgi:hypothetical protein
MVWPSSRAVAEYVRLNFRLVQPVKGAVDAHMDGS